MRGRRRERGFNIHEMMIAFGIAILIYVLWVTTVIQKGYPLWYALVPPGLLGAYLLGVTIWAELESRRKKKTE